MAVDNLVVQKYGGTSVGSPERIRAVAERIKRYKDNGKHVVVVVSAMGHTTDELVKLASEITSNPSKREMDMLLSTGEQISISLLAMALHEVGVDAISFTGSQVRIVTDGNFSNAKIESIATDRIEDALRQNKVVIVAGFQGVDTNDNIVTLGRGGSDTTAVALAAVLKTRDCEIYTDVDGVYSADPRIVKNAKKLNEISYDEMLELARLGSGVLHSRSVEFANKFNVKIHVRSSFNYNEGTIILPKEEMVERFVISGVTAKDDEAKLTIRDIPDRPGIAEKLFTQLGECKIYVNMIVQSTGHDGLAAISFTVKKNDLDAAVKIVDKINEEFGGKCKVETKKDIAIVSAVGVGMLSSYGVAGRMFKIMSKHGINIEMISTSEIGISCVIDSRYTNDIIQAIHQEFLEERANKITC